MRIAEAKKLVSGMENNAGMIVVFKHNLDGTVSEVHRTFRTDSVLKFLTNKTGKYSVEQREERK